MKKIILDTIEEKIKTLLLQYSREFTRSGQPELTLRFTGGWVRDKLLGRPSHDIDVAIDKTSGEKFATGLHNYMVDRGIEATSDVHKIAVNPEKSKHLETATTQVYGLDIDFVNLRSEEYAADSRVPSVVKFGTPQEDAFRRDATLNALFYNLTTQVVEDFTGRGIQDLQDGVLRTPLDPHETFRDDPLRVLRLFRFVGQLGFTIEQTTLGAMHGRSIGEQLVTKVSGERIGTEMIKLLEGPYKAKAIDYFIEADLGPHVFCAEGQRASTQNLRERSHKLSQTLAEIDELLRPNTPHEQAMLWLGCLLQDLDPETVAHIIKGGLKLTRQMKKACQKLVTSTDSFETLMNRRARKEATRADYGQFVRTAGACWKLCLVLNASRTDRYEAEQIGRTIEEMDLAAAYDLNPLVTGKELMSLLSRKPGPWLASALASQINYLLDHPTATKEDVRAWAQQTL